MKNVVSCLYSDYLRYTDRFRAVPWQYDLLKPVERRILLTAHEEARGPKFVKSAKVVGICLAKYHPHGDASCYDTLVRMVNNKFLAGQGNFGAQGWEDDPPAAMRYSECKSSKSLDDGFSEFLKFVPWEVLELDAEPLYLPFFIPIGLMGEGLIQGISLHPTKIPKYNPTDLVKRLIAILENQPLPTIIPNLGLNQVFEDKKGEYESILQTGKGILQCVPKTQITKTGIHILSRNPLSGFSDLKTLNINYESANKIPFYEVIDLSDKAINVFVKPRKGPCDNNFIMEIIKQISCKIHVNCNVVVDDGTVECKGIDELLLNCYNKWKAAYLTKLNKDLENVNYKIYECNILLVVRDILRKNPGVLTIADVIKLNNNPNVSNGEIDKVCSKKTIRHLIEANIDLPSLQSEALDIQNNINNINAIALARVKALV